MFPSVDFAKLNMYLSFFAILSVRIRDGRPGLPVGDHAGSIFFVCNFLHILSDTLNPDGTGSPLTDFLQTRACLQCERVVLWGFHHFCHPHLTEIVVRI